MKLAALLCWAVALPVLHAAGWIKISSANFELLSDAPESQARQTLATFEEARAFFLREIPTLAGTPPPATIVGFYNFKDYKPYSPKSGTLAYFLKHDPVDYIVVSDVEVERMRIAIHEYVHLLVSHSTLSVPLWLNEGMAEVYSTLEAKDGKLQLGEMNRDRVISLGSDNWIRLPQLLRVDERSPEYNESNLENMFYAQSCLLAHMLMLGDGYRDKFPKFLERVSASGSTQTAFGDVYGKSAAEIEKEMRVYFRQMMQGGASYRSELPKVEMGQARPANGAEVGVTLANLTAYLGRTEEARKRFKALSTEYPGNADIEGSLADLEALGDQTEAALAHYRAALALHPASWTIYWNYAHLLDETGGDLEPRMQALELALQHKSDLTEARLRLAKDLRTAGRFSDALARLERTKNVEPQYATARFIEMAVASAELKQSVQARQYAEEAKKVARLPEEKAAVEQLLAALQQNGAGKPGGSTETRSASDVDPDRPTLRHTAPPPPPKKKN